MIFFFRNENNLFAVDAKTELDSKSIEALEWLFSGAKRVEALSLEGIFIGPRREMITPWSTNAVEITQNMGLEGIIRIEQFRAVGSESVSYDTMLQRLYKDGLDQSIFTVNKEPEKIIYIENIAEYNQKEGLALNSNEIEYLDSVAKKIGRPLTDSEVFGFSQVNSEHCRHKIFNGEFVIDGESKPETLFGLIRKTTTTNPGRVVSAYKDNCAFLQGPTAEQFAPASHTTSDFFEIKDFESVITIKAETHNFPTTVEPFNGAATGTGGEIRDRIAGGKGAFPVAGTAVYMTSYPRLEEGRTHESHTEPRKWLYQSPSDILIKASNGASDFGNKFGQPLICGSLDTFEHFENEDRFGFDKVIMLAGGIGYGKKVDSLKDEPESGDKVVLLGGDNYRIGMGGGAVSSVATGEYTNAIELNAVQRSNPEMQKRVYNAIRAISEEDINPVISIHDHGAGGHLNCLSELIETTGGRIDIDKLPVGDPTLSHKEIIGNESQERMGLVIKGEDVEKLAQISARERAPMYIIGEATGDMRFTVVDNNSGEKPMDLKLEDMFGKTPRTVMTDSTIEKEYAEPKYDNSDIVRYIDNVLQLEAVACKDWLTNKVDRSVTGRIALQQCAGSIQLPLNNCGVIALDYQGKAGMATSLGHAPAAALADPKKGSILAITESLTNIMFVPIEAGMESISLSANWMWPCNNKGEDARLYSAVEAASEFSLALGINIPTGKDSLSMTQKYPEDKPVVSPGTVIITAAAEVSDITKCVTPVLKDAGGDIVYVDLSRSSFGLGGSAFSQVMGAIGSDVPTVESADYFKSCFAAVQELVNSGSIRAAHDVSAGGLITALLEMTFANNHSGLNIDLSSMGEQDLIKVLFSERPAAVLQVENGAEIVEFFKGRGVDAMLIGESHNDRHFTLKHNDFSTEILIDNMRDFWYRSSFLLDKLQSGDRKAAERYQNYKSQPLIYHFPTDFEGTLASEGLEASRRNRSGINAAIIREKGSNGEREMAWSLHLAGFDVKDVHMTDLISGRETLEDVNMIVFVGGFSNSDVLNSAKGWAGAFLYNDKARESLNRFYEREDTMSLGVCNGCQLMVELGLITPNHENKPKMLHNDSHKFESGFVGVNINPTNSIMLKGLEGSTLGIWIAHGEGKFNLPLPVEQYDIAMSYSYVGYPANPNGSDYNAAAICSNDGRHLAMMPHLERAIRSWNWASYPQDRNDEVTPWIRAFVDARKWIEGNKK